MLLAAYPPSITRLLPLALLLVLCTQQYRRQQTPDILRYIALHYGDMYINNTIGAVQSPPILTLLLPSMEAIAELPE